MGWAVNLPRRRPAAGTVTDLQHDVRVLRSTLAAQASSIASLATQVGRMDARLESVMTNGLPARPVCTCGAEGGGR